MEPIYKKMKHMQVAALIAGSILLTSSWQITKEPKQKPDLLTLEVIAEKNIHNQWQAKSLPTLQTGELFVRADFLYWRADEEGLDYGYKSGSNTSLFSDVNWNPGVRAGMGYTFSGQDYWTLQGLWTFFHTHQGSHASHIVPWWGTGVLGDFADHASAHWDLTYNTVDLDLGRDYFIAKTLSVHPLIGIRGALIEQQYHTHYESITPASFKADTDFWGIGAHLAASMQWHCSSAFSLLGNIGASLLYADFNIHETYSAPVHESVKDSFTTGAANLEAMLGFEWQMFFDQNKCRVSVVAGYEWSEWFSQNRITKADTVNNLFSKEKGNLTLQGASLQVRLDF
jgi:hypothetical protein